MALLRPDGVGTLQGPARAQASPICFPPQLTGPGVAANGKLGQEVLLLRSLGLGEKATILSGCSRG